MATSNGRFLKVDGAFSRPIDWNAINISAPAFPGLGGPMPVAPNSRTLAPAATSPAGGGSSLPSSQGSPSQPAPATTDNPQTPSAPDPSTQFNLLMMDLLKGAQGVGTADLLKRKRELERAQTASDSSITPETLRTLSPAQQDAIRTGKTNALSPEIDENAYELKKAQDSIDNFFKVFNTASTMSQDFADKMVAPDSVIQNAQKLIQADSSKMATILAGFNDKTKEAILGGIDYAKLKDPSAELDAKLKKAQIDKIYNDINIDNTPAPTGNTPGVLSPLAQAVQNGTIPITSLPSKQRAQVAAELATSGIPSSRQTALSTNLDVVQSLLDNPNMHKISGFLEGKLGIGNLEPSAQLALNQFNQLKGILSLENRQQLKGQGAISDFEFKVLSQAATALDRNLSDADFKTQLGIVRDVFAGKYAGTTAGGADQPPTMTLGGKVYYIQPDGTYK